MLLAGGIMLAPQVAGVMVVMLAPDPLGSAVPVLAALLLLDRAPPRWWVPALTGIVLTCALVADKVLIVTAVLPLPGRYAPGTPVAARPPPPPRGPPRRDSPSSPPPPPPP